MTSDLLARAASALAGLSDGTTAFALMAASGLAAWTALTCLRAQEDRTRGPDMAFWLLLAAAFALYATIKGAHLLGLGQGLGGWLRDLARDHALYAGRRPFQIAASVLILLTALAVFAYGLYWVPHLLKRYRLAIGFASLAFGFALIRFVSLHEVDAWIAELPWTRPAVDLTAALGASLLALSRLRSLLGRKTGSPASRTHPQPLARRPQGEPIDQR